MITNETIKKTGLIIENVNVVQPKAEIMKFTSPTGAECVVNLEKIARKCYKSEDLFTGKVEDAVAFLKRTIFGKKDGHIHDAMIEHEGCTVCFTCDRGVSHEIVRHRIASFAQESTRYCNYSKDKFGNKISVIDPSDAFDWGEDEESFGKIVAWLDAMESAGESYFDLLDQGCTPQQARDVLPNSLKTEIVVTMNFRSWRNFFSLRDDAAAHPQMRQLASKLHEDFKREVPFIFDEC